MKRKRYWKIVTIQSTSFTLFLNSDPLILNFPFLVFVNKEFRIGTHPSSDLPYPDSQWTLLIFYSL